MSYIENTDHFSDEGLMALHLIYAKAKAVKFDYTICLKEAAHYRSLELRVPLRFAWEVEKLLLDNNIST